MFTRMLGPETASAMLKDGLDASVVRARGIANRIANVSTPAGGFSEVLDGAQAGTDGAADIDLEGEMAALADEQIRFEAISNLLQKVYSQVRASVRERS
jgi:flagellar basal body rod protein FlgB